MVEYYAQRAQGGLLMLSEGTDIAPDSQAYAPSC